MRKLLGKDYFFYAILFLTTLITLNKLLLPGYILTLDMVWPEKFKLNQFFGWSENLNGHSLKMINSLPLKIFYFLLNQFLPSWIIQKIVLTSILFFAGIGAYQLAPVKNRVAKLFAGLLYMINPFTYIRFLVGQYNVLIGHMLLPFLVKFSIDFFFFISSKFFRT